MDNKENQQLTQKDNKYSIESIPPGVKKKPDLTFRIIKITTEILMVCSGVTIPCYLLLLLFFLFQWAHVNSFAQLPFADKIYLVLVSSYWMYAPILVMISYMLKKEKSKSMIIPLLILGGCILYIYLHFNVLPASEE